MLVVKQLLDPSLISDACALLYRVLVENNNWNFLPDNPSQLRVEIINNKRLLLDRFTDNAVWFGAFDQSTLVGCIRITFVDENNKLEIEGYPSSYSIQQYLPAQKNRCVELTRLASLFGYNGIGVLKPLFLAAFQYCQENHYSICGASSNAYIIKLFKDIHFPLKMELAFKYEEDDPAPVNFYFADDNHSEIETMIARLESYDSGKNNNNSKIFEALELVAPILPTLVYWHDTQGVVLGLNALCLKGMGVSKKEEVLGKTPYEFYPKDVAAHILNHNKRVMETGEVLSQDEQIEDIETGKVKIFRSIKAPLYNDQGKIIGIIGSSSDVTKERQADALKAEFIQNMQHDIRTPMAGIFSLLDSANKSENLDEFKKYLPYALTAAQELLDLHNEVLDFDNIEYGLKPLYERKFSLLELLHGTIHLNSAAALVQKSSLALQVDNNVPDILKGDDYRLKKILINLIGNAIKFTEGGKVKVYVSLMDQKEKSVVIRFAVEDTGMGISQEKLQTIFEKFTRLNPSNHGKFKGTGLGLHIVKKFAHEIGAELDVTSEIHRGTVFTIDASFDLPLSNQLAGKKDRKEPSRTLLIHVDKLDHSQASKTESFAQPTPKAVCAAQDALHVCLIEDDLLAMNCAQLFFSNLSVRCHIEKAMDVSQALKILREKHFDLVVSDIGLPDGTGFDIIKQVKQDPNHLNYKTPFVALTAHSDAARKEMAKNLGFLSFYNKPLTMQMAEEMRTYGYST
jgi:PAS domain S-box-containing protein